FFLRRVATERDNSRSTIFTMVVANRGDERARSAIVADAAERQRGIGTYVGGNIAQRGEQRVDPLLRIEQSQRRSRCLPFTGRRSREPRRELLDKALVLAPADERRRDVADARVIGRKTVEQ